MALTLTTIARNGACNGVVDLCDQGAGAGYIEFQTSGDVEAATLTFNDPAFGNSATGVATAGTITPDSSAAGGVVDRFRFYDSDANEVLMGVLALAGGDMNLNTLTIQATDIVAISTLTVTMPDS